jgi:hypothetical protein
MVQITYFRKNTVLCFVFSTFLAPERQSFQKPNCISMGFPGFERSSGKTVDPFFPRPYVEKWQDLENFKPRDTKKRFK